MTKTIELTIKTEISETHEKWLDEILSDDVTKEDALSDFIAGDSLDRQVEEFIHDVHQQEKR